MAVIQLPFCLSSLGTAAEIPCQLKLYRAAIRYGVEHSFVDAHKVGIIGFSATGAYVLAALEKSGLHFDAAEIVDATADTYTQFVNLIDLGGGDFTSYDAGRFGGPPFGRTLKNWLSSSPGFSIYKIKTPLLIQANGRIGTLAMWEPYAVLHYLRRPVDFAVIQQGTHPPSNPLQQQASEDLGLKWFRFWLENKRPKNKAEYRRWSALRGIADRNGTT